MKQRDIQIDKTTWSCVQSLSGVDGAAAERAQQLADEQGEVHVVCTPSGGAQSVRLALPPDWLDAMSDEALAQKIGAAAPGAGTS